MRKTRKTFLCKFLVTCIAALSFAACSDKIDDSDLYVFKGESAYSYCAETEGLQKFAYLCSRVHLSGKSKSTVSELLSARGNYTVFAPSDDAIQSYLDSINNTPNFDITLTSDSIAEYIVRNSIIDNGQTEAYLSTQFTVGTLGYPNMNNRYIQIDFGVDSINGRTLILVNGKSRIITSDEEVSNGIVHSLDRIIDMSNSSLPDLISQTENLRIFSRMLELTGWADSIVAYIDEDYEEYHVEEGSIDPGNTSGGEVGPSPEHRFFGFTVFPETDSVYVAQWGIPEPQLVNGIVQNWEEIEAAFIEKCKQAYPRATGTDLTKQDNAVNQFISYHLLPFSCTWKNLVVHHSEMGYAYNNPNTLTINCWEYYEAMGSPRRLLKFTEGRTTEGRRINRYSTYDNGFYGTYEEVTVPRPGILVSQSNGKYSNNAINGFYYPINEVLIYDNEVPNTVLNERMRYDFASICPDLMTNGLRQVEDDTWRFIPSGYLKNWWYTEDTYWRYVPYHTQVQDNMQGDEINIIGQYDLTFRLPPVPYEGTYELRICAPQIQHFGMFQVYLGTDRLNPTPIGLPLDFRIASSNPNIGWEPDVDDVEINREIDKRMRNHGYMKNNKHAGRPNSGNVVTTPLRAASGDYIRLRKILWSGTMKPDEEYFVRIKSVLNNTRTCCMLDYFEIVPRSVYAGEEVEDPW